MHQASLEIVEEEDVPTLVRTLLASCSKATGPGVVMTVRRETAILGLHTQMVTLEVISTGNTLVMGEGVGCMRWTKSIWCLAPEWW